MTEPNAADPNTNPNPGGQPNSGAGAAGAQGADWHTSVSEENRSHVAGFQKPDDFVKAYVDLKGKVPQVPDKPDGYKIEFEGVEIPKELQEKATQQYTGWREWAQKNGLTQAQFKQLISEDAKMRMGNAKTAQADFDKNVTALKGDWKNEYDANLQKAEETVKLVFDEEFATFLKSSGLGNDPRFVKGMFNLSKKVSEDTFTKNQGTPQDTRPRDPVTGSGMLNHDKKFGAGK